MPYSDRINFAVPGARELHGAYTVDLYCEFSSLAEARSARSRIRYMAALFPDMPTSELAVWLKSKLPNEFYSADDLRLVLEGFSLADASKETNEIPLESIRTVGRFLQAGATHRQAAAAAGISEKAVACIDETTKITDTIDRWNMDTAVIAAREGWQVNRLAKVIGRDRHKASRLLREAKSVLRELGEVL